MLKRVGLLLVGSLVGCGGTQGVSSDAYDSRNDSIINGDACTEDDAPEAVAIVPQVKVKYGGQNYPVNMVTCTGTLIAPDVVMAAGHCVDDQLYKDDFAQQGYTVAGIEYFISYRANLTSLASQQSQSLPSDAVHVIQKIAHPKYTLEATGWGPQKLNDISVLFLEEVQSKKPAVVITAEESSQVVESADVEIVGWGQTSATVQRSGQKTCATSFINQLGDWEMQIGGGTSTSRKCHGDSGGPTFMNVETSTENKRRVIGITSHAYDQTDCQKGGVDTRVDAYLDWLDQTLTEGCDEGVRAWCDVKGLVPPEFYEPKPDPDVTPDEGGGGEVAGDGRRVRGSTCATGGISAFSLLALAGLVRRRSRR